MINLTLRSLFFPVTSGTDALDDVLRLSGCPTFRQGDGGNADVGEAVGAVAADASEMDVPFAVVGVAGGADAILLRAGAVVNLVQQVSLGKRRECAEERGAVHRRQRGLQISQRKGIAEAVAYLTPDKQANRCHTDACIVEGLLVRNVLFIIHGNGNDREGDGATAPAH